MSGKVLFISEALQNFCRRRAYVERARWLEWRLSSENERARARRLYTYAARSPQIQPVRSLATWFRRHLVYSGVIALLFVCAIVVALSFELRGAPPFFRDLALGKRWTASSAAGGAALSGVIQAPTAAYFFHTDLEPAPSVTIDLGKTKSIHWMSIENREDCCKPRALPLVLEVSNDNQRWRELSRRAVPFTTWRPRFPFAKARYVRLRVERHSHLHLRQVQIF